MVMVLLAIKIVHFVMMYSIQFVVSMELHIKIFVNSENVLESKLLTMDLAEFLTIDYQKVTKNVIVLSDLNLSVVLIMLHGLIDVFWTVLEISYKMKVLVWENVVVLKLINQFVVWTEKHTWMIVKENVKVLTNYMMVNVQILNQLDVNIVKVSLMLYVVLMELLMTTYVISNVLVLNFSVKQLVLQLKKIVNVIKDMSQFVVLITEHIEINVWWNVLKSENNTMVFVEIMKLIILKFSVNVNVVVKYNLFVVLIIELILTLVSLIVLLVVKLFIGVNVNILTHKNVVVKIMKCQFVVEISKHTKTNVLWIVWK